MNKPKVVSVIVSAVCCLCMSFSVFAQENAAKSDGNMVKSPGAEMQVKRSGLPPGWGFYGGSGGGREWGVTEEEAHSGKKSVYLKVWDFSFDKKKSVKYTSNAIVLGESSGYTPEGAFDAKANTRYYFSFWIKGKGIHCPLRIRPTYWLPSGKRITALGAKIEEGPVTPTDEWKQYHGSFLTFAKYDGKFDILILIYGTEDEIEEGATIWVDDVYVGIEPSPDGII